jgi:ribulose-5-phosphate 4-epimerase/fuculose-1-phosphate aldolase
MPEDAARAATLDETELRIDLAAAFRIAHRLGWHESVGNHFSAAVSADGKRFLLNPKWRHFSAIRASDLLLLDADDPEVMTRADAPDASAWCIHGTVHAMLPEARVLLHCHPVHATALCTLQSPEILPIDQNTARFFGRVAVDTGFGGMADEAEEGRRIAACLSGKSVLLMGNHGVSVAAPTVAAAFEDLYFLEKAAQTLLLAHASGRPLSVMPDDLAAKTAADWQDYAGMAEAHFAHWKAVLDRDEPDYRA